MSKITNKFIANKLKEVSGIVDETLPNEIDDETALKIIFQSYDDEIFLFQEQIKLMNKKNAELKVIELQLRVQIKKMIQVQLKNSKKRSSTLFCKLADPIAFQNAPLQKLKVQKNDLFERCEGLQSQKVQLINSKDNLQKKILQYQHKFDKFQTQIECNIKQKQSKDESLRLKQIQIDRLKEQNCQLIARHKQVVQKYQSKFMKDLGKCLQERNKEMERKHDAEIRILQQQNKQLSSNQLKIQKYVSFMFNLGDPNREAKEWVELLEQQYNKFKNNIKEELENDDENERKKRTNLIMNDQKNKLQARRYLLSKLVKQ